MRPLAEVRDLFKSLLNLNNQICNDVIAPLKPPYAYCHAELVSASKIILDSDLRQNDSGFCIRTGVRLGLENE